MPDTVIREAEALEPKGLREEIAQTARRMVDRYDRWAVG